MVALASRGFGSSEGCCSVSFGFKGGGLLNGVEWGLWLLVSTGSKRW